MDVRNCGATITRTFTRPIGLDRYEQDEERQRRVHERTQLRRDQNPYFR